MKTPEQKLRFIMEAAGECVHNCLQPNHHSKKRFSCSKCSIEHDGNPSPDDLNALFRLAKKLQYHCEIDVDDSGLTQISLHANGILSDKPAGQSLEGLDLDEALLNALFVAKGGLEDE